MLASRSSSRRIVAALLAWVSVLTLPARAFADCPMQETSAVVASTASSHAHDEHAGHVEYSAELAPEPSDVPAHHTSEMPCPDLAHCAVAGLAAAAAIPVDEPLIQSAAANVRDDAPPAPSRAVEPPPPRR